MVPQVIWNGEIWCGENLIPILKYCCKIAVLAPPPPPSLRGPAGPRGAQCFLISPAWAFRPSLAATAPVSIMCVCVCVCLAGAVPNSGMLMGDQD